MKTNETIWSRGLTDRQLVVVVAVVLACSWNVPLGRAAENGGTNRPPTGQTDQSLQPQILPTDPWQANQLIKPEELAKVLAEPTGERPLVFHVGPGVLWPNAHIDGSKTTGPGGKPEGIQSLKHEVQNISKDKPIVLYCGCCPWNSCPNIRPTFRTLQQLGFKNVKVLYLPKTFQVDWIAKGFPVKKD